MENPTYLTTKDFLVSGEPFSLLHDTHFDMLVTHPQPAAESLASYYESENYISHTDAKKGLFSFLYQTVKQYSLQKKVSLVSTLSKQKGTLLDIGAGTGDFLVAAKKAGWSIHGVEVHEGARKRASEKGITLDVSLDTIATKKYDVITMWHVLEHMSDLKETLSLLESMLTPSGVLIIAVPNFKSFDAKYYKEYWAAYDVPRHLFHFSRTSLPKLLNESFVLKKIKPMIFDSFYVSLLSEKYKTGKAFSMKGVCVGFLSNMKAWRSKEYSSLIYCFKKVK